MLVFETISCELNIQNVSSLFVFYPEDVFVTSLRQGGKKWGVNLVVPADLAGLVSRHYLKSCYSVILGYSLTQLFLVQHLLCKSE